MKVSAIGHKFVDAIPDQLDEKTLYIALEYRTVMHKCFCGCGYEVVTPLGPTDWKLTFNGVSVSLYPSVGNWSLACRSHYWIDEGNVKWASQWTSAEIESGRLYDRQLKKRHYLQEQSVAVPANPAPQDWPAPKTRNSLASRLKKWVQSRLGLP